ncbi:MAG TPA: DUF6311 domain-containing protein [Rhizomicrobium sp.]|nr:DUF6311 domain-containing protein [Rhizomicrobium sp.]
MTTSSNRSVNFLFLIIAVIAGVVDVWTIVGWREINPQNLTWMHGDPAQYQIGWEFLRRSGIWHLPPTWISELGYPTGVSASYLDIIPIVGVPLALASPVLPTTFQYLGCYALLSFILQAYFGFRLAWRFSQRDVVIGLIGGSFFLLSPVLTKELYGHFALLSQWMVLAAIDFYFSVVPGRPTRANIVPLIVLASIACAVQPYIAFMVDVLALAAIARTRSVSNEQTWQSTIAWTLLLAVANFTSLLVFGFIVPGNSQFEGSGYTLYSMNLLAPINPQSPGALLLPSYPVVHGWTLAGYGYLGVGIILLLCIVLIRRFDLLRSLWSPLLRPLLIISTICTFLALSVEVCFGNRVLFTVPVPRPLFHLLAAFRGCGRLFWPAYYLIFVAAIAGICATIKGQWSKRALLAFALVLQYFDVSSIRGGVAATARKTYPIQLVSPVWRSLPAGYKHLVILPALQCGGTPAPLAVWPEFAHIAARDGMTLNSVYVARVSEKMRLEDCVRAPSDLIRVGFHTDSVYVLSDELTAQMRSNANFAGDCRSVDGFNLCTRYP